jgi:excinuclease ABC subunit B
VDPLTGEDRRGLDTLVLFGVYVTQEDQLRRAVEGIEVELAERLKWLEDHDKLLERRLQCARRMTSR